jgi:hypothetical protein
MKRRTVMRMNLKLILICALVFSFISIACVGVGETEVETRTIELGDTITASVELDIGAGELSVHGGARELIEATFTYNVDKWKPQINSDTVGTQGVLKIRQGKTDGIPMGDTKNRWDISLNETIPIDLKIDMGAGQGILDLRDVQLSALDIDGGVGELRLDLSGERDQNLDVDINCGVGSATIYLPEEVGARVYVSGGIGSVDTNGLYKKDGVYINDAFNTSDVAITIQIDAGIGSVELKTRKASYV